jgi:hypothetical protein
MQQSWIRRLTSHGMFDHLKLECCEFIEPVRVIIVIVILYSETCKWQGGKIRKADLRLKGGLDDSLFLNRYMMGQVGYRMDGLSSAMCRGRQGTDICVTDAYTGSEGSVVRKSVLRGSTFSQSALESIDLRVWNRLRSRSKA